MPMKYALAGIQVEFSTEASVLIDETLYSAFQSNSILARVTHPAHDDTFLVVYPPGYLSEATFEEAIADAIWNAGVASTNESRTCVIEVEA